MSDAYLTVGDLAAELKVSAWRIRRIVDGLGVDVPRAGAYRLIPRALVPSVVAELRSRGWLPAAEPEVAAP